jgi:hypothetical protein
MPPGSQAVLKARRARSGSKGQTSIQPRSPGSDLRRPPHTGEQAVEQHAMSEVADSRGPLERRGHAAPEAKYLQAIPPGRGAVGRGSDIGHELKLGA